MALRLSEGLGCTWQPRREDLARRMAEDFMVVTIGLVAATQGLILVRAPRRGPSAKGMGALALMPLLVCPWHRRCAGSAGAGHAATRLA